MGIRGLRINPANAPFEPELNLPEKRAKRSVDNARHSALCVLAAKWLHRGGRIDKLHCSSVAVEPFSPNVDEMPDVFGWNYWTTAIIEVKVSRSDFLADAKKPFRQNPETGMGEYRFYCCPSGLIKEDELPDKWGLLYESNGKIEMIRNAKQQESNPRSEFHLLASIARKFGLEPKIYECTKRKKE